MKIQNFFLLIIFLGFAVVGNSEILDEKCGTLSGTISLGGSPYKIKVKDTNKYYLIESDGLPENIAKNFKNENFFRTFLEGEYSYCQLYTQNEGYASVLPTVIEITEGKITNTYFSDLTIDECGTLGSGISVANCIATINKSKENELDNIISKIQSEFIEKKEVTAILQSQTYWKDYAKSECSAREATMGQGYSHAINYNDCMYNKLDERIKEIYRWHYCNDNGCPERNEAK